MASHGCFEISVRRSRRIDDICLSLTQMRYIDFEDQATLFYLRVAFVVSSVLTFLVLQVIKMRIANMQCMLKCAMYSFSA